MPRKEQDFQHGSQRFPSPINKILQIFKSYKCSDPSTVSTLVQYLKIFIHIMKWREKLLNTHTNFVTVKNHFPLRRLYPIMTTLNQLLAHCQQTVGWELANCRPNVSNMSVEIVPTTVYPKMGHIHNNEISIQQWNNVSSTLVRNSILTLIVLSDKKVDRVCAFKVIHAHQERTIYASSWIFIEVTLKCLLLVTLKTLSMPWYQMVGVASPSYVVSMEIWLTVHALLGLYSTP